MSLRLLRQRLQVKEMVQIDPKAIAEFKMNRQRLGRLGMRQNGPEQNHQQGEKLACAPHIN